LARISKAKELNMDVDEYVKLLRMAKTGKFSVIYNNVNEKGKRNLKQRKAKSMENTMSGIGRGNTHKSGIKNV
jgi:hypothetical protein